MAECRILIARRSQLVSARGAALGDASKISFALSGRFNGS
jgi:hypothetical protein